MRAEPTSSHFELFEIKEDSLKPWFVLSPGLQQIHSPLDLGLRVDAIRVKFQRQADVVVKY